MDFSTGEIIFAGETMRFWDFKLKANDGVRTRESWSHNPMPYRLATPAI